MSGEHDQLIHPHPIWWILVLGGLALFFAIGLHPDVYAYWIENVHELPDPPILHWALWGVLAIHIFEGVLCYRIAKQLDLNASAKGWGIQSFMLGYPSTRLLFRLRERVQAEQTEGEA
jgi:hypothetical protein